MHNPQVTIRFGLMLEAYFRGSGDHIEDLTKQVRSLYFHSSEGVQLLV